MKALEPMQFSLLDEIISPLESEPCTDDEDSVCMEMVQLGYCRSVSTPDHEECSVIYLATEAGYLAHRVHKAFLATQ